MTSYAELRQTCNAFQENFAILSGKHTALQQAFKAEQAAKERLQGQLEESVQRESATHNLLRQRTDELHTAASHNVNLREARITAEHLQAQLSQAQRRAEDREHEHQQQVQQLRDQMADLLQRISVTTEQTHMQELQKQVRVLEGCVSAAQSQLLEERERAAQQLLTAHTALREQQQSESALTQRVHALQQEVQELRHTVQQSSELYHSAIAHKERSDADSAQARHTCAELERSIAALREELSGQQAAARAERESVCAAARLVEDTLRAQVERLTKFAAAQQHEEHEKQQFLQSQCGDSSSSNSAIEEAVVHVRAEYATELTTLRQQLLFLRDEQQRETASSTRLSHELAECARELTQQKRLLQTAEQQLQSLRRECDDWKTQYRACQAACEEHKRNANWTEQQRELLHVQQETLDTRTLECDQVRLLLAHREEEMREVREELVQCQRRRRELVELANRRLRALRHRLQSCKEALHREQQDGDGLRQRLLHWNATCTTSNWHQQQRYLPGKMYRPGEAALRSCSTNACIKNNIDGHNEHSNDNNNNTNYTGNAHHAMDRNNTTGMSDGVYFTPTRYGDDALQADENDFPPYSIPGCSTDVYPQDTAQIHARTNADWYEDDARKETRKHSYTDDGGRTRDGRQTSRALQSLLVLPRLCCGGPDIASYSGDRGYPSSDVITLLHKQNKQAEELHHQLMSLSPPHVDSSSAATTT